MVSIPVNVRAEIRAGHKVQPDHPALRELYRWTCTRCREAILYWHGEIWGPVAERTCEKASTRRKVVAP